jgi:hypothetical protein
MIICLMNLSVTQRCQDNVLNFSSSAMNPYQGLSDGGSSFYDGGSSFYAGNALLRSFPQTNLETDCRACI